MEGNKHAAFCENKMEAEVPRFVLLEGTTDDLIDEQENKNTSAKTDRSVSLRKPSFKGRKSSETLKKYLLLNSMNC